MLLVACELFDGPFQSVVLRDVVSVASGRVERRTFDVFRNRNKNINVVGDASFLVVALDLDDESDSGV